MGGSGRVHLLHKLLADVHLAAQVEHAQHGADARLRVEVGHVPVDDVGLLPGAGHEFGGRELHPRRLRVPCVWAVGAYAARPCHRTATSPSDATEKTICSNGSSGWMLPSTNDSTGE